MRHGKKHNHLGRKTAHRKALLHNLANALITHKRITTTLAKAKALRVFVEPLVTKAKSNTTHARRVVFGYLQNKEVIMELFGPVAEKVGDRPGGYVRVIRTGFRKGDGAEMAMIEFVDFNEVYNNGDTQSSEGQAKRRRRRKAGSGASAAQSSAADTEVIAEELTNDDEEK
ncbi:MAG: 50S ribosomal protein L17 [Saprospiraceae bacterium]|jgi:large subunit ribosomal protein L17|nr:50S ribosomal protein L17 [Saprospiraceae bacterium]MDP4819980.1 50S ribosomal protein L17 [Saprospiraceae bacterium]MDP4997649.1 50S ribosomal protein L17 [Saprospiraceae bacterium]